MRPFIYLILKFYCSMTLSNQCLGCHIEKSNPYIVGLHKQKIKLIIIVLYLGILYSLEYID